MKSLGYSLTWRTTCFINDGCGSPVIAHTNGRGDFVLFDSLGSPWPIHECYRRRFCIEIDGLELRKGKVVLTRLNSKIAFRDEALAEYNALVPRDLPKRPSSRPIDLDKINPEYFVDQDPLRVVGIVQDVLSDRIPRLIEDLGSLGATIVVKALAGCSSQITIIDTDRASYTTFADLRQINIRKGDLLEATLTAKVIAGLDPPFRFIASSIKHVELFPDAM